MVIVEAAGVDRRAAVAQQQSAGIPLERRLNDRLVEIHDTLSADTDVAVCVDESGDDPAVGPVSTENRFGPADRLTAQDPVGDPPFDLFTVGQSAAADMENR